MLSHVNADEAAPPPKRRRISKKSTTLKATNGAARDPVANEETRSRDEDQEDEEPVDGLLFSSAKDFLEEEIKVKDEPEEAE